MSDNQTQEKPSDSRPTYNDGMHAATEMTRGHASLADDVMTSALDSMTKAIALTHAVDLGLQEYSGAVPRGNCAKCGTPQETRG